MYKLTVALRWRDALAPSISFTMFFSHLPPLLFSPLFAPRISPVAFPCTLSSYTLPSASLVYGAFSSVHAKQQLNGMAEVHARQMLLSLAAREVKGGWTKTGVAASGQIAGGHEETDAR